MHKIVVISSPLRYNRYAKEIFLWNCINGLLNYAALPVKIWFVLPDQ